MEKKSLRIWKTPPGSRKYIRESKALLISVSFRTECLLNKLLSSVSFRSNQRERRCSHSCTILSHVLHLSISALGLPTWGAENMPCFIGRSAQRERKELNCCSRSDLWLQNMYLGMLIRLSGLHEWHQYSWVQVFIGTFLMGKVYQILYAMSMENIVACATTTSMVFTTNGQFLRTPLVEAIFKMDTHFSAVHEGLRKDMETAFGVLL